MSRNIKKETREFYEKMTMGMSLQEKLKWVNNSIDSIEMCYDTLLDDVRQEWHEYIDIRDELRVEIKNGKKEEIEVEE